MKLSRTTIAGATAIIMGLAALAAPVSASAHTITVKKAATKVLLWHLEFSGKAGIRPSSTNWNYEVGNNNGYGNSEEQYYRNTASNISLDGKGNLQIKANRIPWTSPVLDKCISCKFTSARINTAGKLSFKYGRMEARIKMPAGEGTWPAFWMLGTNLDTVGWPLSGEIDIMEGQGRLGDTVFGTAHGPGYSGGSGIGNVFTADNQLSAGFHTYAVEWKKDSIKWYLDNNLYHELTPSDVGGNEWVFNHPFFLIVNLAMGGLFTGDIDPNLQSATMTIDYIRYYKLAGIGTVYRK